MTKKLSATVLLSCLAGGDGGERSVVWSSVLVGFAAEMGEVAGGLVAERESSG
jgi:hypothetical protein